MGLGGQCCAPAALLLGRTAGANCAGGWVGPRLVWMGAENLAPTRIQPPDHQVVASQPVPFVEKILVYFVY
jgi:hypothetical protein